jgi:hypothetical protein
MMSNGHDANAAIASQACRVCGAEGRTRGLVDVYGAATCHACLRRIDADPRQKRQLMLTLSDAIYW